MNHIPAPPYSDTKDTDPHQQPFITTHRLNHSLITSSPACSAHKLTHSLTTPFHARPRIHSLTHPLAHCIYTTQTTALLLPGAMSMRATLTLLPLW